MSEPSFLLAGDQELLVARGIVGILPVTPVPLAQRAAAWLAEHRHHGAPLLVGALPFDKAEPGWLFQPESLERGALVDGLSRLRGAPLTPPSHWQVTAQPTRGEYAAHVADALRHLRPGDGAAATLRKVVLARTLQLRADGEIDPEALFARLARDPLVNAFSVALPGTAETPRRTFVGATPELLIDKRGDLVTSCPLAGSAPRRPRGAEDDAIVAALLRSEKDRREHATVVEWIADTLAPHCRTLNVPDAPSAMPTATMWHLGTRIAGTLKDSDVSVIDLAAALHPTPAIAGVPHDRALALIAELEGFDRGFFTGAVGWCDEHGDGRWLIALRCALVEGAAARLYAGAGIVAGSDPEQEAAETSAKFRAMLDALGVDEDGQLRQTREAA